MEHADVVVVGGGIAGLSVAWRLAPHVSVVVVETEQTPASHATGRSAAMLNVTSGPPAVGALASASRAFLESPPEGFATAPLLSPRGLLWVGGAGSSERLDAIAAAAPALTRRLGPTQALELVPRFTRRAVAAGAVFEPGAMGIDVAELVAGYRRGLVGRAGRLLTRAEAVTLERRADGWDVTAGSHHLRAATVVDAAGAWGDVVAARAGVAPLGLRPLRRTAAVVPCPVDTREWPMVMDVDGGWYALADAAGLLVSAAGEVPARPGDARPEETEVALALHRVGEALDLALQTVRRAWAGLRTFAADGVPVVGPDPAEPSFVWLVGQGGAGIKTAPALAEIAAAAVLHGEPVPAHLGPGRFAR